MLESFLRPLDTDDLISSENLPGSMAYHLRMNTHGTIDLDGVQVAILGVKDMRFDGLNHGTSAAPDKIRQQFYRLMKPQSWGTVADLGNIEAGDSLDDTLFALQTVLDELHNAGIVSVVLGGSEVLAKRQYEVLKVGNLNLEVVYVGKQVNLREGSLLNKIVLDQPNHLFNLTTLGYQTYLTEQESLDAMERMYFDLLRVGEFRAQTEQAEPLLRNAHLCVFDCASIKMSEFPGHYDASPNGLRNEEACLLTRYAGMGNAMESIGFYNFNPDFDVQHQSAKQVAQMIWFFLEGCMLRRKEDPLKEPDGFLKYRMGLKSTYDLVFYKSKQTNRWWMELPHPRSGLENTIPVMVPCTYADYLTASQDELPDRWWRFYQKYA
ncbi:MAG: arginase [Bacteroidetes bacterium]|nr:MAG: arginase [Bacteroidota bacterium]